jgi:hypothetical protein
MLLEYHLLDNQSTNQAQYQICLIELRMRIYKMYDASIRIMDRPRQWQHSKETAIQSIATRTYIPHAVD